MLFNALGQPVEEQEFMRDLVPGSRIALWYVDDTYWHERVLLAKITSDRWAILTPDGDLYIERILCRTGSGGANQAILVQPGAEVIGAMRGRSTASLAS